MEADAGRQGLRPACADAMPCRQTAQVTLSARSFLFAQMG